MKHTFFYFVDTELVGELCTTYNYFNDSFKKELSSYRYNAYPDFKNNKLKTLRNTKYLVEKKEL